jgi:hypothetical protein
MRKKNRKTIIKQNKKLVEKQFLGFFEKGFSNNEKSILKVSKKEPHFIKDSFRDFFNYNEFKNLFENLKSKDDVVLNENLVFFRLQDEKDLLSKYSNNKNKFLLNFGYNFKEVYSPQKNDLFFAEDLYLYNKVRQDKKYFLYNSLITSHKKKKKSLCFINFWNIRNYISYEREKQLNNNFSISKKSFFNGLQDLNLLFENKNLTLSETSYLIIR